MTKLGRSLTIRENRLGLGETGTRALGGGSLSHSWGVGRSLPGPALMPGRRSGRARLAPPCRHPRASFPRLLGVGLPPEGSSPHRAKPRQRGCHPTARVVGDPPSTAGRHGGSKAKARERACRGPVV